MICEIAAPSFESISAFRAEKSCLNASRTCASPEVISAWISGNNVVLRLALVIGGDGGFVLPAAAAPNVVMALSNGFYEKQMEGAAAPLP